MLLAVSARGFLRPGTLAAIQTENPDPSSGGVHSQSRQEDTVKLGDVLRKEREKKDLSIEDTAAKLNISARTVRRYEKKEDRTGSLITYM